MMTIYELLRVLARNGWKEKARLGLLRILEHPARPRVYLKVRGRLSEKLDRRDVLAILAGAGIKETDR